MRAKEEWARAEKRLEPAWAMHGGASRWAAVYLTVRKTEVVTELS